MKRLQKFNLDRFTTSLSLLDISASEQRYIELFSVANLSSNLSNLSFEHILGNFFFNIYPS